MVVAGVAAAAQGGLVGHQARSIAQVQAQAPVLAGLAAPAAIAPACMVEALVARLPSFDGVLAWVAGQVPGAGDQTAHSADDLLAVAVDCCKYCSVLVGVGEALNHIEKACGMRTLRHWTAAVVEAALAGAR